MRRLSEKHQPGLTGALHEVSQVICMFECSAPGAKGLERARELHRCLRRLYLLRVGLVALTSTSDAPHHQCPSKHVDRDPSHPGPYLFRIHDILNCVILRTRPPTKASEVQAK